MRLDKFKDIKSTESVYEEKCKNCSNHVELAATDEDMFYQTRYVIIRVPCNACHSLVDFNIPTFIG